MKTVYRPEEWAAWSDRYRAQFFNSLYGGRLVAMLCTETEQGANVCPVSQILHVGASPASVGILLRPESDRHQTRALLDAKRPTSLHWMPSEKLHEAHQCSAAYPAHASEAEAVGWTFHPYPMSSLEEALISVQLDWKETHPLFNGTALYVFHLTSIQTSIVPREDGFWDFQGGLLHSQGLDHYGRFESESALPYARP